MKLFLLDTNIIIGYIRGSNYAKYVEKKFNLFDPDNISVISMVSVAEIKSLAYKFGWGKKKKGIMNDLLKAIPVVKINSEKIIDSYSEIDAYNNLKHPTKKNPAGTSVIKIPQNDIWIAATAQTLNATLIATDKHFEHLNKVFINFIYIDQSLKEEDAE